MRKSRAEKHLDKHGDNSCGHGGQNPCNLAEFRFNHGKPNKVFVQFGLESIGLLLAFLACYKNFPQSFNVFFFKHSLSLLDGVLVGQGSLAVRNASSGGINENTQNSQNYGHKHEGVAKQINNRIPNCAPTGKHFGRNAHSSKSGATQANPEPGVFETYRNIDFHVFILLLIIYP
jgi:hypothetical protein